MTKFILVLMSLLSISASANAEKIYAKIFYSGDVGRASVIDLIEAIDAANNNKHVDGIYLYLNSYGGDMDSGEMAASVIRSSKKPVITVAMSTVGSSATLMLCAGSERRALPDGSIYLHPSVTNYEGALRPNTINELSKENKRFSAMFRKVYEKCTSLGSKELDDILYSESNRVTFTPEEAIKIGIISSIDSKIIDTSISYYISDD